MAKLGVEIGKIESVLVGEVMDEIEGEFICGARGLLKGVIG